MSPKPVSLSDCLPDARLDHDAPVTRICSDSRDVRPGSTFVAISGTKFDGHRFVDRAIAAGASAVVVERPLESISIPQAVVSCSAEALGQLCLGVHDNPQDLLSIAGITGTNGKSTTAWLLREILRTAGHTTGLLGTIEYSDGVTASPASLTTPDAHRQAKLMSAMVRNQCQHCVMEISSHALQQQRCAAIRLAAALITNVTHDHLDYHQTHSHYRAAKSRIAELLHVDAPLLLNADDPGTMQLLREHDIHCRTILFGRSDDAELRYSVLQQTHRSQRLRLSLAQGDVDVRVRLIGEFNAFNCLAAAAIAEQMGMSLENIGCGLESTREIPGRMERIDEGQSFQVYVDYAHTPDALERCLQTVRQHTHGNLICVTGAGGDRDQEKRPLMGQAAALADRVVLTSDNPRTESPTAIVRDIQQGFTSRRLFDVEIDRHEAIRRALEYAQPGDAIVLAGKGHEQSQVVGAESLHFDDRQVARELLKQMNQTTEHAASPQPNARAEHLSIPRTN